MGMNRRNVLAGLGTIVVGSGAVLGSGAFSQVTATREMSIAPSADSSANLELIANNSDIASDSGGAGSELEIDGTSFNTDAETIYKNAFDITQSSGNDQEVAINVPTGPSFASITFYAYGSENDDISGEVDLSSQYVTLSSGADLVVGIEVDTDDTASSSDSFDDTVKIEAVQDSGDFTISGLNDSNQDELN
jgi:hypothetical protein